MGYSDSPPTAEIMRAFYEIQYITNKKDKEKEDVF